MKYSKEFKEEALKLSDEIGLKKAAQDRLFWKLLKNAIVATNICFSHYNVIENIFVNF